MTELSVLEFEKQQAAAANATGLQTVVFIHGLWLLPSSWDRWVELFEDAGFSALTPGWPDDAQTIEGVADHFELIIRDVRIKPVVIGHSVGGLISQILAGKGVAKATVAIDPAPFRGILPLPVSPLKSAWPVFRNPANRNRAVPLTYEQFRFAFANTVNEEEAQELYRHFAVPASGVPLFESAAANLNPWTEAKVDWENPNCGPLLLISSYHIQQCNENVTEVLEMPNRGHAIVIDSRWREIAEAALAFARRFV